MTKVAFYVNNALIANRDCTTVLSGNPGIGGTEYLSYYTACQLQLLSIPDLNVILLTSHTCSLPDKCKWYNVENIIGAIEYCQNNDYEILVVNYNKKDFYPNIFSNPNIKVKIIVWAHNVISNEQLTIIAKTKSIRKIVNVGREQLDLYRDHIAFNKSTYIYNSIPIKEKKYYISNSIPFPQRKNEVTYLGNISPVKGFHILAKAWPKIVKAVPDAHLNVIGSASVYCDTKLGKYGIAEDGYEKKFMPYLIDYNGKILPSVTFYGKLGEEKNEILSRTKVGVPNPSGISETFCLSAVEMELYGCRMVTKKYVGFLDTIPGCAGCLYEDESSIADIVIRELQNTKYDYNLCYNYIYENFRPNKIISKWISLLKNVENDFHEDIIVNKDYNYKNIRELNRKIKSNIPFGYNLPTLDTYIKVCNKFLRTKFPILY